MFTAIQPADLGVNRTQFARFAAISVFLTITPNASVVFFSDILPKRTLFFPEVVRPYKQSPFDGLFVF
jgi:hypothetical protein